MYLCFVTLQCDSASFKWKDVQSLQVYAVVSDLFVENYTSCELMNDEEKEAHKLSKDFINKTK